MYGMKIMSKLRRFHIINGFGGWKTAESHSYERSLEIVWSEHYSSKLKQITNGKKKLADTAREQEQSGRWK